MNFEVEAYEGELRKLRKAAKMALEALELGDDISAEQMSDALEALRQALAQPEQEPVAWVYNGILHEFDPSEFATSEVTPLYTAPPKREWIGLTDEEIDGIYKTHHDQYGKCQTGGFEYERTIEAKLKEKNT